MDLSLCDIFFASNPTQNTENLKLNDHLRSFRVIYFGVSEKPLRDYILQCNNFGLVCESLGDIASERSENNPTLIWCRLSSELPQISA